MPTAIKQEVKGLQKAQERISHVLLVYRQMIPSIRLCGHCQMEYLAREEKIEYRAIQEMKLQSSDLNWADVVLLGRLESWYEYRLAKKLHATGRQLIYIIDDDLLNIPPEFTSAACYGRTEIQEQIRGMIGMSDAIISPSPLLLDQYATNGRRAILVEEPALDPVPYRPHDPSKPVKIGFAGSIDRTGDLESILGEALTQLKRAYGDRIRFEFFGAIPSFAQELGAACIPYQNSYDVYRRTLNSLEWDIGLAPMPSTPFHACKHYNKFIEYAAAGMMGVFSETEPYTRLKPMNAPAVFCKNDSASWYEALRFYIEHPEEREALRRRCTEMAETQFSVARSASGMLEAAGEALSPRDGNRKVTGLHALRIRSLGHTLLKKWRTYGLRLPLVAFEKILDRLLKHVMEREAA